MTNDAVSSKRPFRVWLAVATLILVAGTSTSVLAARADARNDASARLRDFETASAKVASTLKLALQREEDLVVSQAAFMTGNPGASMADYLKWTESVQAFQRYPELEGIGSLAYVPASQLPAFTELAAANSVYSKGPDGKLAIYPPGDRPYYCFSTLGRGRTLSKASPVILDFCAGNPWLMAVRDSGQSSVEPVRLGEDTTWLAVQTPIYRDGARPATVEARRAAFAGWTGMTVDPKRVLNRALEGHPGLGVTLRWQGGSGTAVFSSGTIPPDAQTVSIDFGEGWRIQTFRAAPATGWRADADRLGILVGGIAGSLLLAALVFVLGTGRARALRLVGERTDELRHQALHDPLTGLPNRALILDRTERLLARNRRNGTDGAALFVDLDEFKNINDTLGHEAGDQLLRAVTERLTHSLRDTDTIGRLGGDEFVVLVDGGPQHAAPELVAQRLLDVLDEPFDLPASASPLAVRASVGVAVGDRDSAGDLLRDADVALYRAKAAGKGCYEVFRADMEQAYRHRLELELELRMALDAGQFHLVYQPIYHVDDLVPASVEALLRWHHPRLGVIPPDEFIPLLEASGQIVEVGRWVLNEACRQAVDWNRRGIDVGVSVNVSARQFESDAIVDHVRESLAAGLDSERLTIEITETALAGNVHEMSHRLRAVKALGVQVAVDDFGTGYSSLAYLHQFPVDVLKIDRVFTGSITGSPESDALVSALVKLGSDLGLRTLAEGVETVEQMEHLRDSHVDEVQGYLFSRPLDPEALEALLRIPRPRTERVLQAST